MRDYASLPFSLRRHMTFSEVDCLSSYYLLGIYPTPSFITTLTNCRSEDCIRSETVNFPISQTEHWAYKGKRP